MMRRESGLVLSCSTTLAIWSTWPPSGVGHERHWTPYTGPRSPSGRAHSSQIVTSRSCSQRALPSPRRNQSSSRTIERRCTFLVVTSGKPSRRSKRIWWPNTLFVPVPVRSALATPWSRTWRRKSSYCERIGRSAGVGRRRRGGGLHGSIMEASGSAAATSIRSVQRSNCSAASRAYSPPARDQLGVGAGLDDLAGLEDDDAVGALHGREAVRDDDRRAAAHRRFERGLDHPLAFGVERARRLVEQQQRRVLQHRARDRDALALAAREANAALAEEGPVAVGQRD